jgi:PDZ domain-containing secreted protein
MCNVLDHGDEIISVDGQPTPTKEAVLPLLRGSDVPGSNVDITVKKV